VTSFGTERAVRCSVRCLLVTLLAAACGGSSHAVKPTPPVEEKPDPYMEWHRSEPKSPTETFRTTKFEPPQQCGQGPYRMVVEASGAKFSEGMSVSICTNHAFKGSISYLTPQQWAKKNESGFGFTQDKHHEKCRVDGVGLVTPVAASGGGAAKPTTATKGKKADPGAAAAPVAVELHGEVVTTSSRCPNGQQQVSVINTDTIGMPDSTSPVWGKGRVVIEIWSELPNDLAGASFLVQQRGVPDGVTAETWKAYREAHDAWFKGYDDALARSRAAGHKWTTYEQAKPTKQPPAARAEVQTPRPSPNASWIPGYWSDSDGWVWSAGFWRVPKEDIEQEKTVEAPAPPPVVKVEPAPQPEVAYYTARRAVWTPGYWMWNGAGYVWIAGSWRIPEATGMTWVAPTWRPSRRGTSIYVPGGFVRLRRR
jgi:hypothetical protein